MNVAAILPAGWAELLSPDAPRIGIGIDVGTTEKKKSNPSALTVAQEYGRIVYARLIVRWKSRDPEIMVRLFSSVLEILDGRFRPRCAIDATSEKYFAVEFRRKFNGKCPVELVVASETIEVRGERMTKKVYTGSLLCNAMEDGLLALPPERFIRNDWRLVVRDRGSFDADVDESGGHADTADSTKLALYALRRGGGPAEASAAAVGGSRKSGLGKRTTLIA